MGMNETFLHLISFGIIWIHLVIIRCDQCENSVNDICYIVIKHNAIAKKSLSTWPCGAQVQRDHIPLEQQIGVSADLDISRLDELMEKFPDHDVLWPNV